MTILIGKIAYPSFLQWFRTHFEHSMSEYWVGNSRVNKLEKEGNRITGDPIIFDVDQVDTEVAITIYSRSQNLHELFWEKVELLFIEWLANQWPNCKPVLMTLHCVYLPSADETSKDLSNNIRK